MNKLERVKSHASGSMSYEYCSDKYLQLSMPNILKQKEKESIISTFYAVLEGGDEKVNFLEKYKDLLSEVEKGSLINFIRSYPYLIHYMLKSKEYRLTSNRNILVLDIKNKEDVLLQLRFLNTGIIDFVSMDSDDLLKDEKLIYVLKGSLSTSSKLSRSYKIKRLLQILDVYDYIAYKKEEISVKSVNISVSNKIIKQEIRKRQSAIVQFNNSNLKEPLKVEFKNNINE